MVIVPQPTPVNFTEGRGGQKSSAIVDHIMVGTMAGTLSWFRNPAAKVSAHYGVGRNGLVVQYVDDADTAWHAGSMVRPSAELVLERRGENPNRWTIGIEHEGDGTDEGTPEQVEASAHLHALLSDRHGIPLDRRHVILHREIRADKTCPGLFPVERVLVRARELIHAPEPARPRIGDRRWSRYFGEWLILTRYVSDAEWYYVRESDLRGLGARASTPWSAMPEP